MINENYHLGMLRKTVAWRTANEDEETRMKEKIRDDLRSFRYNSLYDSICVNLVGH